MSIEVSDLTKVYGTQKAVDNISFTAEKGKITGFLGPNGAGKSTTMKIATGYISADKGDVLVDDLDVKSRSSEVKKIIGYLPEHNPLYLSMYVKEFLSFIAEIHKIPSKLVKGRVADIISLCGLEPEKHKRISALSKGYRQRVGLAKALISDPSVLILDEPTTGLDPNQILEIRNVIKDISREKTVLLSTHIMQEVEALCDRVVIINKGKIVANDTLQIIKSNASKNIVVEVTFENEIDSSVFENIPDVERIKTDGVKIEITSNNEALRNELLKVTTEHNLPLVSITNKGSSLEEIFHSLTRKQDHDNAV